MNKHEFEENYKNNATQTKEKLDQYLTKQKSCLIIFKNNLPLIIKQHENLEKLYIFKQGLKSLYSTNSYDDSDNIDIIPIRDELIREINNFIKKENIDYLSKEILDMYAVTLECKKITQNYENNQQQEMFLEVYEYIDNNSKNRDLQFYFEIQKKITQILQYSQQKKIATKTNRLQQLDNTFEFLQNRNKKFKLTTFDKPPDRQYEILIYYDLNNLYWAEFLQGRIQIFCKPNQRLIIINQLTNLGIDQVKIQQSIYELFTQQIERETHIQICQQYKRRLTANRII
ncbi:hypothetical protein pb186bvf_005268 [Paramecium bursaria]